MVSLRDFLNKCFVTTVFQNGNFEIDILEFMRHAEKKRKSSRSHFEQLEVNFFWQKGMFLALFMAQILRHV